jgi:hypothetical protein
LTVTVYEAILVGVVITLEKKNYLNAIKSGFVLIFSAMLASALVQQFLDSKIESIIQSQNGINSMIWVWGFSSLLAALLFPLIQSLLCSFYLASEYNTHTQLRNYFSNYFELSLIETLRAWGKSFLWFFVFIIPGFVKYSYYMLAPFVVLFSKLYDQGQVDALEVSEKIFKKYWIYFSVQLFLFYFLLPLLLSTVLDDYRSFNTHPLTASLSLVFETLMILLFHFLILKKIFSYLTQEKDLHYVDVQLA